VEVSKPYFHRIKYFPKYFLYVDDVLHFLYFVNFHCTHEIRLILFFQNVFQYKIYIVGNFFHNFDLFAKLLDVRENLHLQHRLRSLIQHLYFPLVLYNRIIQIGPFSNCTHTYKYVILVRDATLYDERMDFVVYLLLLKIYRTFPVKHFTIFNFYKSYFYRKINNFRNILKKVKNFPHNPKQRIVAQPRRDGAFFLVNEGLKTKLFVKFQYFSKPPIDWTN